MEEDQKISYILIATVLALIIIMGIGLYMAQGQINNIKPTATPRVVYQNDKNIVLESKDGSIEVKTK